MLLAHAGLSNKYDPDKSGLAQYIKLEKMLTSGNVDVDVISDYPEFDKHSLPVQLGMFKQTYKTDSLHHAKFAYRSMAPAVRSLFPQVLVLLKLLLVCPVSSCECERSFSAYSTWLRATMTSSVFRGGGMRPCPPPPRKVRKHFLTR